MWRGLSEPKDPGGQAIAELAKEDKIEYRSFGGITYVAIKGKTIKNGGIKFCRDQLRLSSSLFHARPFR